MVWIMKSELVGVGKGNVNAEAPTQAVTPVYDRPIFMRVGARLDSVASNSKAIPPAVLYLIFPHSHGEMEPSYNLAHRPLFTLIETLRRVNCDSSLSLVLID